MKTALAVLLLLLLAACGRHPPARAADPTEPPAPPDEPVATEGELGGSIEVLRDAYGVPHIFAPNAVSAAFAWGWVQAEDQRQLLLMMLYAGEGRAAETFGRTCQKQDCVEHDMLMLAYDVPRRAVSDYAQLKPDTRALLEAYALGVNRFFSSQSPKLPEYERPVTAQAVAGAIMSLGLEHALYRSQVFASLGLGGASNQFAATGARTAPATTVVSSDPHTPWGGSQPMIHVHAGDLDVAGYFMVGPAISCGGNNFVQFGCTTLNAATTVVVQAEVSADGRSYRDFAAMPAGGFVPFTSRTLQVKVKGAAAVMRAVQDTRWGPVERIEGGKAYATHVFAADNIKAVDYRAGAWRVRSGADYLALFQGERIGEASSNRIFGSRAHELGYVYGAQLPVLNASLDWSKPVSSLEPRIAWAPERWYVPGRDGANLPHLFGTVQGDFIQNSNDHPAFSTLPAGQIPLTIPLYLNAQRDRPTDRGERLLGLLGSARGLDAVGASVIAGDLKVVRAERNVEALRRGLAATGVDARARWGDDVAVLIDELLAWSAGGYQASISSEGMTVLQLGIERFGPLPLPDATVVPGLAELDAAAQRLRATATAMRALYGTLHVPWGQVHYAVVGGRTVPMPGGTYELASPFMAHGDPDAAGNMVTDSGSHQMQISAFDSSGLTVLVAVPNGQVDESLFPASPHVGQTIDAFAARQYRKLWLSRDDVLAHPCSGGAGHEHAAKLVLMPGGN